MIAFALTTLVLCLVVAALAVYDSAPDPYEED